MKKTALASQQARPSNRPLVNSSGKPNRERIYNPKVPAQQQSLQGRVAKLLGKAGAAQFKRGEKLNHERQPKKGLEGIAKTPESIVFEGFRASAKSGKPKDLKLGSGGKKRGKPKNRSTKRASEWKKSGGKTTK
jgi:nucleolar protein 12